MKNALLLSLLLSVVPAAAFAADLAVEPTAAPAVSGGEYSGYVEGYALGGQIWSDTDIYGYGFAGVLAYKLDANWQIEGEVSVSAFNESDEDYAWGETSGYGVLHANYYGDGFAIGGFGGVGALGSEDYGVNVGVGGVEGQVSLTNELILGGQVGYVGSFDGYYHDENPLKVWFAEASVQYFITDNFKIEGKLGIAKGDSWYSDSVDLVQGTVGAAYQFDNSPVSLFAEYSYVDDQYYDTDYTTVKVGARFAFDGESLKSTATTGASHELFDLSGVVYNRW